MKKNSVSLPILLFGVVTLSFGVSVVLADLNNLDWQQLLTMILLSVGIVSFAAIVYLKKMTLE